MLVHFRKCKLDNLRKWVMIIGLKRIKLNESKTFNFFYCDYFSNIHMTCDNVYKRGIVASQFFLVILLVIT